MNPKQLFANTTTFLLVVLGLSCPSPQYPKNRYSFLVVFVLRGVCDACLSVTSNNYLFGEKKCVKIALLKAQKLERERGWKMHSKHHDDYMYIIPPRCLTSFYSKKSESYKMHFDCFSAKKNPINHFFWFYTFFTWKTEKRPYSSHAN